MSAGRRNRFTASAAPASPAARSCLLSVSRAAVNSARSSPYRSSEVLTGPRTGSRLGANQIVELPHGLFEIGRSLADDRLGVPQLVRGRRRGTEAQTRIRLDRRAQALESLVGVFNRDPQSVVRRLGREGIETPMEARTPRLDVRPGSGRSRGVLERGETTVDAAQQAGGLGAGCPRLSFPVAPPSAPQQVDDEKDDQQGEDDGAHNQPDRRAGDALARAGRRSGRRRGCGRRA